MSDDDQNPKKDNDIFRVLEENTRAGDDRIANRDIRREIRGKEPPRRDSNESSGSNKDSN